MRFFPIFFVLLMFFISGSVFAQDAEDTVPLDEYKNVPPGMLMTGGTQPALPKDTAEIPPAETEGEAMTIEELKAAYDKGQYDLVAKHIIPLASNGHPPAQELLGIMYRNGQGVPKDPDRALQWLTKAAEANQPLAQHHLAIISFTGEGVTADPVRALMWLYIAIVHYADGPEKKRAIEDRNNVYAQLSRRDRDRALELARDWLDKTNEGMLLDLPQE